MTDHLIETLEDGVATLTMNRPQARNALSGEMMSALSEAVHRLAGDPKARVVVLTGAGGADRKSTRLNSSHVLRSRMPSSA